MKFQERFQTKSSFSTAAFFLFITVFLLSALHVVRGMEINGTNELLYLDGEEAEKQGYHLKRVFEDYLNLTLTHGNVELGARFDILQPGYFKDNVNLSTIEYEGIRKVHAEYCSERTRIRAGNIFGIFGNGLSLNLYEDRRANIDHELQGLLLSGETDLFSMTFLGGRSIYRSYADTIPDHPEHTLRGGDIVLRPLSSIEVGASYVWTEDRAQRQEVKLPAARIRTFTPYGDVWAEYLHSSIDDEWRGEKRHGSGTYMGVSLYPPFLPFLNLTADYKYYKYDFDHNKYYFADPPYCRPSIYRLVLLNRHDFDVDKDDEVGYQVESNISIGSTSTVRLNYNVSSSIRERSNLPHPASSAMLPFEEMYLENINYLGEREFAAVLNRRRQRYPGWDEKWLTGGLELLQPFSGVHSITVEVEAQKYEFLYNHDNPIFADARDFNFWSQIFTLSYNWSPFFLIYANFENSSEKEVRESEDVPGISYELEDHYISAGLVINFLEQHRLTLLVGSERGGKICRGGTCIDINPFRGVRLELSSSF